MGLTITQKSEDKPRNGLMKLLLKGRARVDDRLAVFDLTEKGFAIEDVKRLVDAVDLFREKDVMLKILGMSERTLHRRNKNPEEALSADQSARALRFAEVLSRAQELLGSRAEAERWMADPAMGLAGRAPIDLITNPVGYEIVDDFLTRLEHGVYQ
jgi:putative toxin-antitoxin system antitoxin component (TIGR02293 family)